MKNAEKAVEKKLFACSIEFNVFFLILHAIGANLWNAVSIHFMDQCTDLCRKVKKDFYFKELDFSVQSLPWHYQDFRCF